ncbi:unnamed protein product [Calicophoron daubneyi]|uniref:Tetrapyrrole biosynthesis uroporphyrinogen III synthase domain-containing protein n=1 Tax=Calicophoron daubneyi TaxID=300641 RepID=A0AAV2TL78_CALDB
MHVLLLKSAGESGSDSKDDPYYQVLSSAGNEVTLIETLDFHYHTDVLGKYQSWTDTHSAIVFTSPRAVNAFIKAGLKGKPTDLCFVVGPATEAQAKRAGFSPKGASKGDAEELAKYIVSDFGKELTKPVFFPTGQLHRDVLPTYLEKHEIKVESVTTYSSKENEKLKERFRLCLCEGNPIPDCVVFFSPSGVSLTEDILKSEVKPHRPKIQLVAMGRATASRLKEIGVDASAVSPSPKPESLLSVIKSLRKS